MAEGGHHHHHEHHGNHIHGHADNEAFTEANRAHWNNFASRYTSEQWQKDMLNAVNAFIYQNINWIGIDFIDPATTFEKPSTPDSGRKVRVLDYACGPGTITHALGARVTEYVGIDLSENMVQEYNARFNSDPKTSTTSTDGVHDGDDEKLTAHAVVGNLLDSKNPSPEHLSTEEFFNFDLVVVGLGFHHFPDIALATSRLVERLKPGGVFLILDFVTHAMDETATCGSVMAQVKHTVAHAGFSEQELKGYFEAAGRKDFEIVRMDGEVLLRGESKRRPFLAKGRKA